MKPTQRGRQKTPKSAASAGKNALGFTEEERAAMKERIRELRADAEDGESLVVAKIAEMQGSDREMGQRLHAIIRANAPDLTPRLWYGMPAYTKDDKVVCHVQPAQKFKTRYATLGFSDKANFDDGEMWPVVFALKGMRAAEEARIVALVKRAVS